MECGIFWFDYMVGYLGSISTRPIISIERPNKVAMLRCTTPMPGLVATAYIISSPNASIRNPTSLIRFFVLGSTSLIIFT